MLFLHFSLKSVYYETAFKDLCTGASEASAQTNGHKTAISDGELVLASRNRGFIFEG